MDEIVRKRGISTLDSEPPDPRRGDTVRVLLIEDSRTDALRTEQLLSTQGCVVAHRTTLEAGLSHLRQAASDVVVLDLELPDARGLEGLERLRTAFPHMPVVVVTGSIDPDAGHRALHAGAQDYLQKGSNDADRIVRSLRYAMTRKRSENLRHRLEHTDRLAALGQLAAGIAHEINNPLAFIMANMTLEREHFEVFAELFDAIRLLAKDHAQVAARLAETDYLHRLAELEEILRDNLEGAERIRTIVKDLRGFARGESDQITKVDLNETVMTACNITRNEVRHRAKLVTDLAQIPPILGDQARLCQVVVNLLVNASQAIPDGNTEENRVTVSTSLSGNGVLLRVQDTGSGIAQDHLERIFEPFFTTKAHDTGTGLGLALCAETVRRHGGTIRVTSEVNRGTTFEVQLPAHEFGRGTVPEPPAPRAANGQGRVLLVDDEASVRRAFARMLKRDGYEVVEAGSVNDALDLLGRAEPIDVIVCDLVMPDLDGADLYWQVAERFPTLRQRLLFISGGAFTSRAKDFLDQTGVQVIQKPPQTRALETAVREVIERESA